MLTLSRSCLLTLVHFLQLTQSAREVHGKITVYPITSVNVTSHTNYFADPYPIQHTGEGVWIAGTTHGYLKCDNALEPNCASGPKTAVNYTVPVNYTSSQALFSQTQAAGTKICGWFNLQPHQTVSGSTKSWDAAVTLHVENTTGKCTGDRDARWSVIVHARPADPATSDGDAPPTSWIGDAVLVGSLAKSEAANYDGKYFRTPAPESQLYLIYQKSYMTHPARDGVVAWPLDNPSTIKAGSSPTFLLKSDDGLNSQDYETGNSGSKVIETGNIRAIQGKFVMTYSTGSFNRNTYKAGLAWSDTFLPQKPDTTWRKVMNNNPDHLYGSTGAKEALYLIQSDMNVAGWNYVGGQVIAPGVAMVANIGVNKSWVLTFCGYKPNDAPPGDVDGTYLGTHRRPFYIDLKVNVPANVTVSEATDAQLQTWISPVYA